MAISAFGFWVASVARSRSRKSSSRGLALSTAPRFPKSQIFLRVRLARPPTRKARKAPDDRSSVPSTRRGLTRAGQLSAEGETRGPAFNCWEGGRGEDLKMSRKTTGCLTWAAMAVLGALLLGATPARADHVRVGFFFPFPFPPIPVPVPVYEPPVYYAPPPPVYYAPPHRVYYRRPVVYRRSVVYVAPPPVYYGTPVYVGPAYYGAPYWYRHPHLHWHHRHG